jgi:hypothetical protein
LPKASTDGTPAGQRIDRQFDLITDPGKLADRPEQHSPVVAALAVPSVHMTSPQAIEPRACPEEPPESRQKSVSGTGA